MAKAGATVTKGDGTDLCCLVNPIRKHKNCTLSFCKDHWWDSEREKLGLERLPEIYDKDSKCSICGKSLSLVGFSLYKESWDFLDIPGDF